MEPPDTPLPCLGEVEGDMEGNVYEMPPPSADAEAEIKRTSAAVAE